MELYIVDPARLGFKVGDLASFAEVTEAARALSYTVLGFSEGGAMGDRKQILAPHAKHEVTMGPDTKLIILAEEWE